MIDATIDFNAILERVECGDSTAADAEALRAYIAKLRAACAECDLCHGTRIVTAPSAAGLDTTNATCPKCSGGNVCGFCGQDSRGL